MYQLIVRALCLLTTAFCANTYSAGFDLAEPCVERKSRGVVIIFDDEYSSRALGERCSKVAAQKLGYGDLEYILCQTLAEAKAATLCGKHIYAVLTDNSAPDFNAGMEFLEYLQQNFPDVARVMISSDTNKLSAEGQTCKQRAESLGGQFIVKPINFRKIKPFWSDVLWLRYPYAELDVVFDTADSNSDSSNVNVSPFQIRTAVSLERDVDGDSSVRRLFNDSPVSSVADTVSPTGEDQFYNSTTVSLTSMFDNTSGDSGEDEEDDQYVERDSGLLLPYMPATRVLDPVLHPDVVAQVVGYDADHE